MSTVFKKFSFKRFKAIVRKEFIQLFRDPASLRLSIAMPIMLMVIFGYAVSTEVDEVPTVVYDMSKTSESREYIEKFEASGYFKIENYVYSQADMTYLINSGKVSAGIIIPQDFSKKVNQSQVPDTQLLVDGTDPTTARTVLNSGKLVSEMYSLELKQKNITILNNLPGVNMLSMVWYNANMESEKFTIPGLVGLILQNITVILTDFALVREKERGTIEQLMVSPITSFELIFGKLLPYIILGYMVFLFTLCLCVFWFGVAIQGSIPLLLVLGLLFVICALLIGILISAITQNQLQAMTASFIFILPSFLLSGFVFPRDAMPNVIYYLGFLIPLTYFLKIVRGIILKGVGISFIYEEVIALMVFMILIFGVSVLKFKKKLD